MTVDDKKLQFPGLSERQVRALPYLLTSPTWEEGRKKAGISRNTLNKWFKEPEFKRAFDSERNNLFLEAMDLMKAHTIRAVSGLVSLLDTENQTLKRNVCNDILQLVLRFRELQNIEERLQVLERIVFEDEPDKPGRGGYAY